MDTVRQVVRMDVTWNKQRVLTAMADAAIRMHAQKAVTPGQWKLLAVAQVPGYDQDPRPLWEIEEAKNFFKLLIDDCGWYGLVRYPEELGLFGAMQIRDQTTTGQEVMDFWAPMGIATGSDRVPDSEFPAWVERTNVSCGVFLSEVVPLIEEMLAAGVLVVPIGAVQAGSTATTSEQA